MEFNTSTFILEIINFLVLMWVLKHFFYRPVLEAIEKRRLKIEHATLKATKLNEDANALQQSYQNRLNAWEQDKQQLRDAFLQEIESERAQKMQKLQVDLNLAQERAEVIQQHEQAELLKRTQQQAHQQAARFAAKLLKGAACLEMQDKLIELFIAQLTHLQQQADVDTVLLPLRQACEKSLQSSTPLKVLSAFPLTPEQQQQLQKALNPICEASEHWLFIEEPSLLAGLRICLGDLALGINLQDELSGFTNLTLASTINIAPTNTQSDDLSGSDESNQKTDSSSVSK